MNWTRGLLRFWIAATLLWIAVCTALEWRWLSCKLPSLQSKPWEEYRCNYFDQFDPWGDFLLPALLPPLLLLFVGGLVYWAIRGFWRSA